MTLDPQVRRFLDNALAAGVPPPYERPLAEVRQGGRDAGSALFGPADPVAGVEDTTLPGPAPCASIARSPLPLP